jgi:hypothetical protein
MLCIYMEGTMKTQRVYTAKQPIGCSVICVAYDSTTLLPSVGNQTFPSATQSGQPIKHNRYYSTGSFSHKRLA